GGGTDVNPIGTATVNMVNNTGLILGSKSGNYTFDTPVNVTGTNPTIRIQARPFGSAVAGTGAANIEMPLGRTNALTLPATTNANGVIVQMTKSDNTRIKLANVVLNGNATFQNVNTNVGATLGNVT